MATKAPTHNTHIQNGSHLSQSQRPQSTPKSAWGWTSNINSFVSAQLSSTQKVSESFFDNISATLSKKGQILASRPVNPNKRPTPSPRPPSNVPKPQDFLGLRADSPMPAMPPPSNTPSNISNPSHSPPGHAPHSNAHSNVNSNAHSDVHSNGIVSEDTEWRHKYTELKRQHSLKVALLEDQLQQYKASHSAQSTNNNIENAQSPSSPNSKIEQLEGQIVEHQRREKECIELLHHALSQHQEKSDALRSRIEDKYRVFFDKLLSVSLRAGLDPSDIFQVGDADREQIRIRTATFHADNAVDGNHGISTEMEGVRGPSAGPTSPTFNAEECGDDNPYDPEDCKSPSDSANTGNNHKMTTTVTTPRDPSPGKTSTASLESIDSIKSVGDRGTLDHSKLQCIEQNPFIVHDAANLLPVSYIYQLTESVIYQNNQKLVYCLGTFSSLKLSSRLLHEWIGVI